MRDKILKFMQGRYGYDKLSGCMCILSLVLMVTNLFVSSWILSIASATLLVLCYMRIFSKNTDKRYNENMIYMNYRGKIIMFFQKIKKYISDSRHYVLFKCPDCGQKMRIPRGKGRVIVTCPKCKKNIPKKS